MPQYGEDFLVRPLRRRRQYEVGPKRGRPPPAPTTLLAVRPLADEGPDQDHHQGEAEGAGTPAKAPRGGKLARRARSFKEDFLEILSAMRSPGGAAGGGGARSGSPLSPKGRAAKAGSTDVVDAAGGDAKNPLRDLDAHVRQVQFALKHFRDVISKNKLEMLPGNGTVVLETVTTIHGVLKMYVLNEQSSTLVSATNQVYQSLAKLIKLCDDVLLFGDRVLSGENVAEVVQLVEEAVQNLVSLAQDKIANRETNCKTLGHGNHHNHHGGGGHRTSAYSMVGGGEGGPAQRSSLPDIPLTPRERQILEQTAAVLDRRGTGVDRAAAAMHKSQSEESILVDGGSPPPKPPLPGTRTYHLSEGGSPTSEPPPLPPKRRNKNVEQLAGPDFDTSSLTDTLNSSSNSGGCGRSSLVSGLAASFDRISLRSKSPEDTSSLLSASAGSLDSVLNHSREEEEIQVLMDPIEDTILSSENILGQGGSLAINGNSCCCWESSAGESTILLGPGERGAAMPNHVTDSIGIAPGSTIGAEIVAGRGPDQTSKLERLPSQAESGFASMHSLRSSGQSHTASVCSSSRQFSLSSSSSVSRSSQQSSVSFSSSESAAGRTTYHTSTTTSSSTESNFSSTTQKIVSSSSSDPSLAGSVSSSVFSQCTRSNASTFITTEEIFSPKCSPTREANGSPPALPRKTRSRRGRQVSQYDNLPAPAEAVERHLVGCSLHRPQAPLQGRSPDGKPPPLPLKKKHIMAYMEMFGNCSHQSSNEFLRHSVHTYNLLQAEWQQQEMSLTSTQSCSFSMVSSHSSGQVLPPAPAPAPAPLPTEAMERPTSPARDSAGQQPPALPPKRGRTSSVRSSAPSPPPVAVAPGPAPALGGHREPKDNHVGDVVPAAPSGRDEAKRSTAPRRPESNASPVGPPSRTVEGGDVNPLEELDISAHLVVKRADEEGPDVRGGHPDALVIHATKANKNDFLYQEAFLTTYRTFLSPLELIQKLCQRHDRFSCSSDPVKQRAAREAFSLLVRVVSDLTMSDLTNEVLQMLMEFVYQLLCSGDLTMAKALRVKILEKCTAKKLYNSSSTLLSSLNVYTRQASLLDFKSEQIAEQMTLLDSNLFMKIEIPEVLIWAQEQNEERSPNLTRFTEHFNKMSYWARSRILEQNEAKDRERYVVKFIKIMKHLRKINNFNSYLALLSALDSAPIRRLEWQKQITEGLKEYCALIDSSSSFRAYRQALGETQPPCIPYIGLVLQDLTFVHIGNSDLLPDGSINFSKRWQQFNIVENMKRFKKGTYSFKKHERIIAFFNNFDEFLCEEAMWQISESIKPRGGKKTQA